MLSSALVLAGCGSAPVPPPEAPSPPVVDGVGLDTTERTVSAGGRTVTAGLGPSSLAVKGDRAYVTDRVQDALLIFRLEPELELQRRVYVAGGPRRVEVRDDRLVVTVDQGSVELTADGAAKVLRRRTK